MKLFLEALNRAVQVRSLSLLEFLCNQLPSWMKKSSEESLWREIAQHEERLLKERGLR